jgi:hypothetical protein
MIEMIEMLEILLKYYNQFESEIKSNNSDLKRFQYLHRLLTAFHRLSYLVRVQLEELAPTTLSATAPTPQEHSEAATAAAAPTVAAAATPSTTLLPAAVTGVLAPEPAPAPPGSPSPTYFSSWRLNSLKPSVPETT